MAQDSKSKPDDKSRVRENQRRSRARRAELIADLQARVHAYEQQGVAATQEVQLAARRIAAENARLRALLARVGVDEMEIERWVKGDNDGSDPGTFHHDSFHNHGFGNVGRGTTVQEHQQAPFHTDRQACRSSTAHRPQHQPLPLSPTASTPPLEPNLLPEPTTNNAPHIYSPPPTHTPSSPAPQDQDCPNSLTCFCPPPPPHPPPPQPPSSIPTPTSHTDPEPAPDPPSSGLEISCTQAARIIAEMRGGGPYHHHHHHSPHGIEPDREREQDDIWRELGCPPRRSERRLWGDDGEGGEGGGERGDCRVRNAVVLGVLGGVV